MDDDPVFFVVVMKVYRAASELKYSMLAFDAPTIEKTGWLWDHGVGRRQSDVRVTNIGVHVSQQVTTRTPILYAGMSKPPSKGSFRQTAFGWTGHTALLSPYMLVFKSAGRRDACFKLISQAHREWTQKFGNVR